VTILVDPQGAETLALAMHEGKIHLILRNPEDQTVSDVNALSTREMLGERAPVAKATTSVRRSYSAPATQVAARPADKKIRMIRSANVTETPAVADSTNN